MPQDNKAKLIEMLMGQGMESAMPPVIPQTQLPPGINPARMISPAGAERQHTPEELRRMNYAKQQMLASQRMGKPPETPNETGILEMLQKRWAPVFNRK